MNLVRCELKLLIRRPSLLIFTVAFGLLFFLGTIFDVTPSAELYWFSGVERRIISLGDWGRSILLFSSSGGAALFVALVAILSIGSFWPGIAHREVLWSTSRAITLRAAGAKIIAIGICATGLISISSLAAIFNTSVREIFVSAGSLYIPLYLILVWLQAVVWAVISTFLLYLTLSRWATVIIVIAIAYFWSMLGQYFPRIFTPFIMLSYKSFLSWNFVGPFAPLGIVPSLLAVQALCLFGIALAIFAGMMLLPKRLPEWQKMRLPAAWVALVLGIVVFSGAMAKFIYQMRWWVAPFETFEAYAPFEPLFAHPTKDGVLALLSARPYIWTKDGALIFYPANYAMVRLPLSFSPLPPWVEELAKGKTMRHYKNVDISEGSLLGSCSLILIYPSGSPYPAELEGAMRSLRRKIQPLIERAVIWQKFLELVVTPPGAEIAFANVPEGLIVSFEVVTERWFGKFRWAQLAWELTKSSNLPDIERAYLCLYLLRDLDEEWFNKLLEELRLKAAGKLECPKDGWCGPLPYPIWKSQWKEDEASLILAHWQRGEEMGHENYIRLLLQGGDGDQSGSSNEVLRHCPSPGGNRP